MRNPYSLKGLVFVLIIYCTKPMIHLHGGKFHGCACFLAFGSASQRAYRRSTVIVTHVHPQFKVCGLVGGSINSSFRNKTLAGLARPSMNCHHTHSTLALILGLLFCSRICLLERRPTAG